MTIEERKNQYQKFCEIHRKELPIFFFPWWLNAVSNSPNDWDVIYSESGGNIMAVLPYAIRTKKFGRPVIMPPILTQILGPWIVYPENQKYSTARAHEKKHIYRLLSQLPNNRFLTEFHLPYSLTNWLPFFWKNFQETLRYTYVLPYSQDKEKLWKNFRKTTRHDILNAQKNLSIETTTDPSILYELSQQAYAHKGKKLVLSFNQVSNIVRASITHKCGTIYLARDTRQQVHAAIFVVSDEQQTYYLLGGTNPKIRLSGAVSMLLWHAIQESFAKNKKMFNFEGSMSQTVEQFFRGFGAVQLPYHVVYTSPSTHVFTFLMKCYKNIFR